MPIAAVRAVALWVALGLGSAIAEPAFTLKPAHGPVKVFGAVSYDTVGTPGGQVLYPAPGLLGFVAAIATHGAIVEREKVLQKERLDRQANWMVDGPLKEAIAPLTQERLAAATLALAAPAAGAPSGATLPTWELEALPRVEISANLRSITLDTEVAVRPATPTTAGETRRWQMRIVSAPVDGKEPAQNWTADGGAPLLRTSAELFGEALRIAIALAQQPMPEGVWQTVRWSDGDEDRFERARVLWNTCGRLVAVTLRESILAVPSASTPACAAPAS